MCAKGNTLKTQGLKFVDDYWILEFAIEMRFGGVELEARLKWEVDVSSPYTYVFLPVNDGFTCKQGEIK